MSRMKALVKTTAGPGAQYSSVDIPKPGERDVLVNVRAASICGTDLHIYTWDEWSAARIKPPRIFGHEFCGEVVEVGRAVKRVKVGDLVTAETHVTCGQCYQCRTGQGHVCQDVAILGVDIDGAFAEYVVVPEENVWRTPKKIPMEIASLQEPLGNAVHTTLEAEITGNTVLVMGCGVIGLCSAAVAHIAGAELVIGVDVNNYRLKLAQQIGAGVTLNARETDVLKEVDELTRGRGVDVALEMSGHQQGITQCLKATRNGGEVMLLGIPAGKVPIDLAGDVVFKGLTVKGITGRKMFDTWYKVRALLASGRLDLAPLVTHHFPMSDFASAFELMESGLCGKIVIYPDK